MRFALSQGVRGGTLPVLTRRNTDLSKKPQSIIEANIIRKIREGTIAEIAWHFKEGMPKYRIEVNKKLVKKRYDESNLSNN